MAQINWNYGSIIGIMAQNNRNYDSIIGIMAQTIEIMCSSAEEQEDDADELLVPTEPSQRPTQRSPKVNIQPQGLETSAF